MRKGCCLLGLVFLFAVAASAQETPRADVFLGYSYMRLNPGSASGFPSFNANGGSGSFAYNINRTFGVVGDFGGYHSGSFGGGNLYTYLFGPRISYRGNNRFTPFAQVLFGGIHDGSGLLSQTASSNAFALSAGGGVDLKASDHWGIRLGQVEYLMSRFDTTGTGRTTQNNLRVSTGVVFHW